MYVKAADGANAINRSDIYMNIKLKKLNPKAILPKRATDGSAGSDLHACIDSPIIIKAGETEKIPTGFAVELPNNQVVALVFGRSGLGINHNISPANCVGVIDSDYRGEIIVGLHNSSKNDFEIRPNDRIAQLVIMPVIPVDYVEVEELDVTGRAEGGFGSTGVR